MNVRRLLTKELINQKLLQTEYAIQGKIPGQAKIIKSELLKNPDNFPFSRISELNVGNPQFFPYQKIEAIRKVLSRFIQKSDLQYFPNSPGEEFSSRSLGKIDAEIDDLVEIYLSKLKLDHRSQNVNSGVPQESVANFIEKRDGYPSDPNLIFPSNGASVCIQIILNLLLNDKSDGILCSVPTYPVYSGLISFFGGSMVKYYLDESNNWTVTVDELERAYQDAVSNGVRPKAAVFINPGNPTGSVFGRAELEAIIDFCYRRNLLLLADEVYQENVMAPGKEFISFKKVLHESDSNVRDNLEIISFHTISKGLLAECGLRGGYMELENIDPAMVHPIKQISDEKFPNIIGDLCLDLKSNYLSGANSKYSALQELFDFHNNQNMEDFKIRAKMCQELLNSCEGIRTNPIEGAMYAFPSLDLPAKYIEEASNKGVKADVQYCMDLLEGTGLCTVPGSGFGQVDGTWHFRTTILPSPNERLIEIMKDFKKFNSQLFEKYS